MEPTIDLTDNEIAEILSSLKETFAKADKAHDFSHTERVYANAMDILRTEKANVKIVKLAALLHDTDDHKLCENPEEHLVAQEILQRLDLSEAEKEFIIRIISEISFSKGKRPTSAEAQIVQDADRLDAIGAIGIARAFTYGGKMDRAIYEKEDPYCTVQHFYDKLLKIESLIGTPGAKAIAAQRTRFMKEYLDQLYSELKVRR